MAELWSGSVRSVTRSHGRTVTTKRCRNGGRCSEYSNYWLTNASNVLLHCLPLRFKYRLFSFAGWPQKHTHTPQRGNDVGLHTHTPPWKQTAHARMSIEHKLLKALRSQVYDTQSRQSVCHQRIVPTMARQSSRTVLYPFPGRPSLVTILS